MTLLGWLEIVAFFLVILAIARPLGVYMFRVFEGPRPLPRVLGRIERALDRLTGVRDDDEQTWLGYAARCWRSARSA